MSAAESLKLLKAVTSQLLNKEIRRKKIYRTLKYGAERKVKKKSNVWLGTNAIQANLTLAWCSKGVDLKYK